MNSSNPKIGFDRFIKLEWVECALNVRAGLLNIEDLNLLLDEADLGVAARKKTRTVLNRLWLEPQPALVDFADRGARLFKETPRLSASALSWGMAITNYPFFGKVAELMGRLSAIQGDCKPVEIHRRMSEIYGEREGTYRMTNMVIQSQASWGALERIDKGKSLIRCTTQKLNNEDLTAWLIEAVLRYTAKPMTIHAIQSAPVVYPFALEGAIAYLASNSPSLELRSEGTSNQFIEIRGL